jgi:hypothetical protein
MATNIYSRWEPGIGDPTVTGWITVIAYGVALILCYRSYGKMPVGRSRQFWLAMMLIMGLLGINKQLDLQTWFTQTGRDLAFEYGWYERRRVVQALFIAWLVVAALTLRGWLTSWLRDLDHPARQAAWGLTLLLVFVLVRAVSFHKVDKLLGVSLDGLKINFILELSSIAVIAHAAWACYRKAPKR